MSIQELITKVVPNPYSNQSTLPDFLKKEIVLSEGFQFVHIIKNSIVLIIFGSILFFFFRSFHLSYVILGILLLFEFLSLFGSALIKASEIRKISAIQTSTDGKSFKAILVMAEYYNFISAFFSCCISIVAVSISIPFLNKTLPSLRVENAWALITVGIFIFVFFRLAMVLYSTVSYKLVNDIHEFDSPAEVNREFSLIKQKLGVVSTVLFFWVVTNILSFFNIPLFIIVGIAGFFFLFVIDGFWSIKRIKNVDLSGKKDSKEGKSLTPIQSDEKVVEVVFGTSTFSFGYSWAGTGKINHPENSFVITNKRLLFIQVPVPGGNMSVGGTFYGIQNFLWNRGEMIAKGKQLVNSTQLATLAKEYGILEILFDQITKITLRKRKLTIQTIDNKKYEYSFLDDTYHEQLTQALQTCLKEKFVVED